MVISIKGAGASVKVTANVVGPKNKVKWTTSDKSIETVSNGTVKGKGEGTAVITAEANGVKASCNVIVQPGFIAINEKQVTLYTDKPANGKKQLKSSATKNDSIVWASTDESVVKVNSKGLVTAVGAGTAFITLTNDKSVDSCKINVMNVSTDITENSITLKAKGSDQTYMLNAAVIGKNKSVKWKSSDTKVATVSKGKVIGKKEGTATITATANGVSDSVTVKVVPFDAVIDGSGDDNPDEHEHEWGEWETVKNPSTTSEGLKVRKCTKCGETEEAA